MEVHHHDQIDQHHCAQQAEHQPGEGAVHGRHLAAQRHHRALGQRLGVGLQDAVDVAGHRAEVAVLGGGVDVEGRGDGVVADHRVGVVAVHIGDGAQDLAPARGGGDRDVVQIGQGVRPVLRRLGHDRIGDPVPGVQPEGRSGLAAARQAGAQAVDHVALGDAELVGAGAVHIDPQLGIVAGLL